MSNFEGAEPNDLERLRFMKKELCKKIIQFGLDCYEDGKNEPKP